VYPIHHAAAAAQVTTSTRSARRPSLPVLPSRTTGPYAGSRGGRRPAGAGPDGPVCQVLPMSWTAFEAAWKAVSAAPSNWASVSDSDLMIVCTSVAAALNFSSTAP
jgi:hypothetical protein